ncbi:MAG: hypothetical protein JO170_02240 [Verrucomicrobia bacterium]|nr:hypothetical protein [Verrucomicrobiota bacterium]
MGEPWISTVYGSEQIFFAARHIVRLANRDRRCPEFLRSRGVEHRVELRAGDFFQSVPSGADAYLLSRILH